MKKIHVGTISFLLGLGLIGACVHFAQAQPWAVTDVPIMQLGKKNNAEDGSIAFSHISPDGKVLATAGESGPIQLWDLETGEHLQTLHQPERRDLVYTRDGRLLAASWESKQIRVWDVLTNEELFAASWHLERSWLENPVSPWPEGATVSYPGQAVRVSPNGSQLAVAGLYDFQRRNVRERGYKPRNHQYRSILKVWDIATGDERTLLNEWKAINSFAFSPDGMLLAVGLLSGTVEVLGVASGEVIKRFTEHPKNAWIEAVNFSPDGKLLTVVGGEKLLLWEMLSGKRVRKIAGVSMRWSFYDYLSYRPIPVFSPDGRLIATGSSSHDYVVLWDVATGKQYKLLPVRRAESIAFSPDGKLVVTGAQDGTVRVWVR